MGSFDDVRFFIWTFFQLILWVCSHFPLRIVVCDQSTLTRYLMKPICGLINFLKKSLWTFLQYKRTTARFIKRNSASTNCAEGSVNQYYWNQINKKGRIRFCGCENFKSKIRLHANNFRSSLKMQTFHCIYKLQKPLKII